MTSRTSTSLAASAGSPSPRNGRGSGRLPSAKSSHSVRKSSRPDSGLLPTPGTPRPHDNEETAGKYYPSQNQWDLTGVIHFSSPTSTPSTAPDSGEQPYLPGEFHASQRPSPGSVKEWQMTVGSGRKLLEFWPKSSQPGPSLKTLVESLVLSKAWYSRTCYLRWRARVTKSGRLLFQLAPSTPRTEGTGYGLLGTPTGRDHKDTGNMENVPESGLLGRQIAMLPTPQNRDYRSPDLPDSGNFQRKVKRGFTIDLNSKIGTSCGLKLQPAFVEWMQGFPIGWTDLKHSAMPSSRKLHTRSLRQSRRSKERDQHDNHHYQNRACVARAECTHGSFVRVDGEPGQGGIDEREEKST